MIVKYGLHIWEPNAEEEISKLHNEVRYNNFKSSSNSFVVFVWRIIGGGRSTMLGRKDKKNTKFYLKNLKKELSWES